MNAQALTVLEREVGRKLNYELPADLVYHRLWHTEEVVAAARELARYYEVPEQERRLLLAAAWCHDLGYIDCTKGHEERSVEMSRALLMPLGASEGELDFVAGCIRATRLPQRPRNLCEQILCDADLSHLGKEGFLEKNDLFRQELEQLAGHSIPQQEWVNTNISFLQDHHYFTDYARLHWAPQKERYLHYLCHGVG